MTEMSAFLEMGGYGRFVWPAFGLTAVILVGLLVASLRALRAREDELRSMQSDSGVHPGRRQEIPREA